MSDRRFNNNDILKSLNKYRQRLSKIKIGCLNNFFTIEKSFYGDNYNVTYNLEIALGHVSFMQIGCYFSFIGHCRALTISRNEQSFGRYKCTLHIMTFMTP